jgi:hypothetical protein
VQNKCLLLRAVDIELNCEQSLKAKNRGAKKMNKQVKKSDMKFYAVYDAKTGYNVADFDSQAECYEALQVSDSLLNKAIKSGEFLYNTTMGTVQVVEIAYDDAAELDEFNNFELDMQYWQFVSLIKQVRR